MRIALMIFGAALLMPAQNPEWKPLAFLIGKWAGVADQGQGQLGNGSGGCSFDLDLEKKIMIRRNTAAYDSGVKHDDLMIIYAEGSMRAIYFDTENHVIHYHVTAPSEKRVVFESDAAQSGPRYRLTYWMDGALLKVKFEIAAPGGEYKTYAGGSLKRSVAP